MQRDTITLSALAKERAPFDTYRVEIYALDTGWYIVRLHHARGVKELIDEKGSTQLFTGPQWVSRSLRPLGFHQAVLTHADVFDEMIGAPTQTVSAEQRLEFGTRVALRT
ncbi:MULTISPECIES: DUF6482 family protein [unclassified Vreelandella]